MKNFWLSIFLVLAVFSQPIMCQEKTFKIPDEVTRVAKNSNTFALNFYKQIVSELSESNISFSPFSISSAFAMVYPGAKGETQTEMANVLHFPKSAEEMNSGWAWLNHFLTFYPSNASDDIRLKLANALWMQTNFPVLPAFRDIMSLYFSGTFRFVDFKSHTDTARATINAWVKQNTFGKIVDILSDQSIDNNTRMVLISAIYLKAQWKHPFDPHATNQLPFFSEDGSFQTVQGMSQSAYYPYYNAEDVSLLEMPYVMSRMDGPLFSMLFILPNQKNGLSAVEKDLTVETLEKWIKNLETTRALVVIPKFKILQSSQLNELLEKMGMLLPFSDRADFTELSGVKGLKIGNVSHKVYLSIDETGSEAAAATAIGIGTTAIHEQKPAVIFQADHPFMYVLFEKTTGMILFIGRFANPKL